MSNDITFCAEDCNNRMCFRHPSNISKVPHTFAYLKGTEACPMRNQEQRLIDANALKEIVKNMRNANPSYQHACDVVDRADLLDEINNAPTVDAIVNTIEVRPQGKWIQTEVIDDDSEYGVNADASECSNCKHIENSHYWTTTYYNFCPNCGADMRGDELYGKAIN